MTWPASILAGADVEASWAVFDATLEGWNAEFDVNAGHFGRRPAGDPHPASRPPLAHLPAAVVVDERSRVRRPWVLDRYTPGIRFTSVENPARFQCHSRVAGRFRSGRVLLAGDAAHACSPTEGHGMNTGLQDAFNLGWKLALVCRGESSPALLDSYGSERRPVALRVVESGAAAESGQALKSPRERADRDAEIARTFGDAQTAHHEAVALAELDRSYAGSTVVAGDPVSGLSPGDLLPDSDPVHPADGESRPLHELAHRSEHTVFVIGGAKAGAGEIRDLHAALEDSHAGSPLVGAVYGFSTEPAAGRVGRIEPSTTDQLGIEGVTVLALRPERYVGFRQDGGDPRGLQAYLDALTA